MVQRTSLVYNIKEAAALVKDGMTIGIGGFVTTNKPWAFLRLLMQARKKELTVVAPPSGLEVDLLVALGMVRNLMTPYVGAESLAPVGPVYSKQAGKTFSIEEIDLGILVSMLRAQMLALPFLPAWGPVGTSLPELNPRLRWVEDPFGGPPLVAVPPLKLDVVIIHASQADKYGNVQHLGPCFLDPMLVQAAETVIVQVEKIVANEEIRRNPLATTIPAQQVSAVVLAPYGAHPAASQNYYRLDEVHYQEYLRAGRAFAAGNRQLLDDYVDRYIDGPDDLSGYLETVGMRRIFELGLEEVE